MAASSLLVWTTPEGLSLQLSTPAPGIWRVQSAGPDGTFHAQGAAQELALFDQQDRTGIRAPLAHAEPRPVDDGPPSGAIIAWRADGALVGANPGTGVLTFQGGKFPLGGLNLRVARSERGVAVDVALADGERLLGLGERFDACDQRGKRIFNWSEDRWCQTEGNSYNPVPYVYSTRRYGLLLNRFEKSWFDLGHDNPGRMRLEQADAPLDLYVFSGDGPADLLRDLAALTGFAPVPPEWALGVYVCRHARLKEFGTPEGVAAMMEAMERHRLPYTAVILEGWDAYDVASYPAMKGAIAKIRAAGKQPLIYEMMARMVCQSLHKDEAPPRTADPDAIAQHNPAIAQGVSKQYHVRAADGADYLADMHTFNPADAPMNRASLWLDVTNPEAVAWWRNEVWGPLVRDMGIAGAKIDFCEEFPEYDGMRFASGPSDKGEHVRYPVRYNAQMYQFFNGAHATGGVCFSRGGGLGAQRYPLLWAGDQLRAWRFLQPQLTSCLSSGMSGLPFMAFDLGGYLPSEDPIDADEAAIFLRGTQMACFSPAMQTHGTVTRPYDFPDDVIDVYRAYSELHLLMAPYLMEQAKAASETGLPLMRHLALDFAGDLTAEGREDQYMFGPSLMVAPIMTPGTTREVYLPAGSWRDVWTAEVIEGGGWLSDVEAPLDRIPLFVRMGNETEGWRNIEQAFIHWVRERTGLAK